MAHRPRIHYPEADGSAACGVTLTLAERHRGTRTSLDPARVTCRRCNPGGSPGIAKPERHLRVLPGGRT